MGLKWSILGQGFGFHVSRPASDMVETGFATQVSSMPARAQYFNMSIRGGIEAANQPVRIERRSIPAILQFLLKFVRHALLAAG